MHIKINKNKKPSKTNAKYLSGVCYLNKCKNKDWDLMICLGVEVEYMTQVFTHENIHLLECKIQHSTRKPDKLLHISDILALVGF